MDHCKYCGNRLVVGGFFCGACGAPVQRGKIPSRGNGPLIIGSVVISAVLFVALLTTVISFVVLASLGASHKSKSASAGPGSKSAAVSCDASRKSIIPAPSGKPQFVYFYDESCPTCQKLRPVIDELQKNYAGKIEFIQIDTATPEGYCEQQDEGFEKVPAMIFIDSEGYELDAFEGLLTQNDLEYELDQLLDFPDRSTNA